MAPIGRAIHSGGGAEAWRQRFSRMRHLSSARIWIDATVSLPRTHTMRERRWAASAALSIITDSPQWSHVQRLMALLIGIKF
jgi:hypothetical protein